MAAAIRRVCMNCHACALHLIKLRAHQSNLTLLPARSPLEYVAIDILGPFIQSSTRKVPLKSITALAVAKTFVSHWVMAYGASVHLLSDNGSQFTSKLFLAICTELVIKNIFTTTYNTQTNDRTILAGLCAFVKEHPKSWSEYLEIITHAYNTQVHSLTGIPPFDLVVTNPPKPLTLESEERAGPHKTPRQ